MFKYNHTIKLHETDAAGILFFSNQFKYIHDAYETWLEEIGFGFSTLIKDKDYFLPIVHAESDYTKPVFVNDKLLIEIIVDNIGTTSFTFAYTIKNQNNDVVGTAKTVHVTIDKATKKKIPLPNEFRSAIEKIK